MTDDIKTIDGYSHILPIEYKEALESYAVDSHTVSGLLSSIPELSDVDARLRLMDEHSVDMSILTPASPPVETVADHRGAVKLAKAMNDGIARIVADHPDRFFGVATVPMNNPGAMVEEVYRAVEELGLNGVLLYSSVDSRAADEPHLGGAGRPIDRPEFEEFYEAVADLNVPIWLHPSRPSTVPEYVGEQRSKYLIWQMFGWPFELSAAMARIVFGGVFERHPELKIIAHHAGGMIPLLSGRMDVHTELFETFGSADLGGSVSQPYSQHFKKFYADTATFGSSSALRSAIEFFGADHILFGTDAPFDVDGGRRSTKLTIEALEGLNLSVSERKQIHSQTALEVIDE